MRIFIEPTETLLFRRGRSFEAGEGGFAETMFPPTPETIQGALRAAIATQIHPRETLAQAFKHSDLTNLIGDRNSYGRFRITGFTLGQRKVEKTEEGIEEETFDRLFLPPTNLLQDSKGLNRLLPRQQAGIFSNLPEGIAEDEVRYLQPDREFAEKPKTPGWLTETGLQKLLRENGFPHKREIISSNEIFTYESRVGIGMDNTAKTTKEGLLYSAQMIRMKKNFGFIVDIRLSKEAASKNPRDSQNETELVNDAETLEKLQCLDNSWLTLGGERRTARIQVLPLKEPPPLEQSRNGTMLYLATPTYFKDGWKPEQWPQGATLVSAALNRYQPIGGWKLEPEHYGGASKDMLRCVPAGSVYFFKEPVDFPQPLTKDHGWQIGYGISYAGEYK